MKINLILFLLLTASSVHANHDMSRYEIIMKREPFGKEPLADETPVVQPTGTFAKQYRLCMLYTDAQGRLKAGLVSKTNNKNFFLQVGESDAGFDLVEVRLEDGVAIVRQGNETAILMLEGLGSSSALSPGLFAEAHQNTDVDLAAFEARQTTRGALLLPKPDDRVVLIGRPRVALKKKATTEVSTGGTVAEGSSGGSQREDTVPSLDNGAEPLQVADRDKQRGKILSRPFSFQQVAGWQAERLRLK
jgi:hypothetical protein